jgi:hypothetical protein
MKVCFSLLLITSLFIFKPHHAHADEGMWIPMLLEQLNEKEMQQMGMRITAADIYNINTSSLKDAIFQFGGGCTSSVISSKGLLITNHHCGYRTIQRHSTIENDLLTEGFWAVKPEDELPNEGLTATRLVRMEDVTFKIADELPEGISEKERAATIKKISDQLSKEATDGTHYNAFVRPFYYGNQFYLFVTETFKDVRLVGAPPSSIGSFGGDTDNWMWPRHTGDFALYRIYADQDNMPAEYSPDNIPYTPHYSIPVSIKDVQEDDFTFVFGFPGSTDQYLPSFAIEMITKVINPARIALRRKKLDIYESFMHSDDEVRIKYAAKRKGVANAWKKWIGENRGIHKLDGIATKQKQEAAITNWMSTSPERKERYGGILPAFEQNYDRLTGFQLERAYMLEAGLGIEIVRAARSTMRLENLAKKENVTEEELQEELEKARSSLESFYKDYHLPIDKTIFVSMLRAYRDGISKENLPPVFETIGDKFNGDIERYAAWVFDKSVFINKERAIGFIDNFKARHHKKLAKDPAFELATGLLDHYRDHLLPVVRDLSNQNDSLMRIYMQAILEFEPGRRFYPDANSTLRVSYGVVKPYYPRDAVFYHHQTTLEGVMEKDDPTIRDYKVEDKLKTLFREKDFGRYGFDDQMPVCFIGTNHTTGGNSGSPALNADGELIGLNFDRAWEGTMSDLMFDPERCRNIMVDMRYVLFIVDRFAGAAHLIGEMEIVE